MSGWWYENGCSQAFAIPSPARHSIIAVLSPPPAAKQSAPAIETFPGGFKVGDRVLSGEKRGTVITAEEFQREWPRNRLYDVPFRFDEVSSEGKYVYQSPCLEHIKEEVTPAAPKVEPAKSVGDGGRECEARDKMTIETGGAINRLEATCRFCGGLYFVGQEAKHYHDSKFLDRHCGEPEPEPDMWDCTNPQCGAAGRYIDVPPQTEDCPKCGSEIQDRVKR
jgi:hypothetical protein